MIGLPEDPVARELLLSGLILAGSYAAARLLSFGLGQTLARAARRTATTVDERLIQALKRPLTSGSSPSISAWSSGRATTWSRGWP